MRDEIKEVLQEFLRLLQQEVEAGEDAQYLFSQVASRIAVLLVTVARDVDKISQEPSSIDMMKTHPKGYLEMLEMILCGVYNRALYDSSGQMLVTGEILPAAILGDKEFGKSIRKIAARIETATHSSADLADQGSFPDSINPAIIPSLPVVSALVSILANIWVGELKHRLEMTDRTEHIDQATSMFKSRVGAAVVMDISDLNESLGYFALELIPKLVGKANDNVDKN